VVSLALRLKPATESQSGKLLPLRLCASVANPFSTWCRKDGVRPKADREPPLGTAVQARQHCRFLHFEAPEPPPGTGAETVQFWFPNRMDQRGFRKKNVPFPHHRQSFEPQSLTASRTIFQRANAPGGAKLY